MKLNLTKMSQWQEINDLYDQWLIETNKRKKDKIQMSIISRFEHDIKSRIKIKLDKYDMDDLMSLYYFEACKAFYSFKPGVTLFSSYFYGKVLHFPGQWFQRRSRSAWENNKVSIEELIK